MAKIDLNALKKQTIDILQSIKSFAFVLFDHLKNGVDFVITKVDTKKSLSAAKKATLVSFLSYLVVIIFSYQFIKKFEILDFFKARSHYSTQVELEAEAKSMQSANANREKENETYEAILTCGMGTNDHINILACFAGSVGTELELKNGDQYGMFKAYNMSQLGREDNSGFHIKLQHNFSIKAQNSAEILTLSLKIIDSKGNIVFQKSAARFGVISVSN